MNVIFPKHLLSRDMFQAVVPFLDTENIILLSGARQTGKTSLLYLLIQHLLSKGVSPAQIVYFDLENIHDFSMLNGLNDFNDFLQVLEGQGADCGKRVFVFVDEIQHLSRPSSFLKYLHDHYKPALKFIVTGSSSLEIKKKFTDRLTGRIYRFVVSPLSFREFLAFKNEKNLVEALEGFRFLFRSEPASLKKAFATIRPAQTRRLFDLVNEYLTFGGYPGVTLQMATKIRQRDLQEIYSLYVRRDIKDLGNITDVAGYNRLVSLLSLQIGNLVKEQELSVSSGLSRPTVKKYLFLLENTYILTLVFPFFTNKRVEMVKTPKVYFEDIGLRNAVSNNFHPLNQRPDNGAMLENFVFSELSRQGEGSRQIRFWRSQAKSEVDFVWQEDAQDICPIEVKLSHRRGQPVPSGLRSFVDRYHPSRAFIVHLGEFHHFRFKETDVCAMPAWAV
ncbi:MAG: ATP-binding protein [Deltaproteobacteria bacterium]|nr:ATP-binding protein [Deltaproteobacteria bacterium]